MLQGNGIYIVCTLAQVTGISGKSVRVRLSIAGAEKTLEGTDLLVAFGRTPNTEGIGMESAEVECTDRGYIKVNEWLETTASSIWAVGECAGSPQFKHISFDDFRVIRDNLAGKPRVTCGHIARPVLPGLFGRKDGMRS